MQTASALAAGAQARGVRFIEHAEVETVLCKDGRASGVRTAQGEIQAAEKAIADLIEKYEYLKITGYENEVAYPANLERLERANRQAEMEQRRFDIHTCEHKEEQTQWAKRLRVPRGPM